MNQATATQQQAHRIDALFQLILSLMMGLMLILLTPTANAVDRQYYSFEFDLKYDNQHAVILDYWYGDSKSHPWTGWPEEYVKMGKPLGSTGITQMMPPGGLLYVKWRDTDTQKIYEDTVDLRHRLPKNIEDHRIYLMIKGAQLYVYLISPEGTKRQQNEPPNGPDKYRDLKIVAIYPDQTK